jgi:hypothetical protein
MKVGKTQASDAFEVRVNSVKPASLFLLISGREEPSMTDSRWELVIVLLVSSTVFWVGLALRGAASQLGCAGRIKMQGLT